jgi:beta-phosphoglucomutase-like phosphatase (HAD superfamily)
MFTIPDIYAVYLFDMDGTLVATEPLGPEVFSALFSKYGVKLTEYEKSLFIKVWRRTGTDIKEEDYLTDLVHKYGLKTEPKDFIQEFYSIYKIER